MVGVTRGLFAPLSLTWRPMVLTGTVPCTVCVWDPP